MNESLGSGRGIPIPSAIIHKRPGSLRAFRKPHNIFTARIKKKSYKYLPPRLPSALPAFVQRPTALWSSHLPAPTNDGFSTAGTFNCPIGVSLKFLNCSNVSISKRVHDINTAAIARGARVLSSWIAVLNR